jgi:hypothetical protein
LLNIFKYHSHTFQFFLSSQNIDLKEIKNKLTTIKRTKFGICILDLRNLAKEIAKEDYKEFF